MVTVGLFSGELGLVFCRNGGHKRVLCLVSVRVRVRFRVGVTTSSTAVITKHVDLGRGSLPTTPHSIFYSRVGQIAMFSH